MSSADPGPPGSQGPERRWSGAPFQPGRLPATVFQALLYARRVYGGGKSILEDQDRVPLTYDRLVLGACALGAKLKPITRAKEPVGVLLPTSVGAAVAFFALHQAGRTPAMLNFTAGPAAVRAACSLAGVRRVLTSRRFVQAANLTGLLEALERDVAFTWLEDVRESLTWRDRLTALGAAAVADIVPPRGASDDTAVILFTSGTTGTPKGVALSHANLIANVEQCRAHIAFAPAWVFFNTMPVFHAFGLTGGLLLPLIGGLKAVQYPTPLHHAEIPRLVQATGANVLISTDTFARQYARSAKLGELSSLLFAVLGAERVRDDTRALLLQKIQGTVLEGYGATECAPIIAVNQPDANRPGTVGRLLPGMEAELSPVPGIAEGARLSVRGPNVMKGYLDPAAVGEVVPLPDGWFDTGDLAAVDAEGFITVTGRTKRFARVGAEMVSLAAVEARAEALWPDARHAAIEITDERIGERFVLVTDQPDAEAGALAQWTREHGGAAWEAPRRILVAPEIPVLPTGKVDYAGVRAIATRLLAGGEGGSSERRRR